MSYRGDYVAGDVVDFKFTTITSTGGGVTLSGSPDLIIYKDNSTTGSTAGITLTVDFAGVTGLNHVRVQTTGSTSFYVNGSEFGVSVSTGTVSGTSIKGYIIGSFSLQHRVDAAKVRDFALITAPSTGRTELDAQRFLRNKWTLSTDGTLTVTKEDDTTTAWTSAITTSASAVPITGSDPT